MRELNSYKLLFFFSSRRRHTRWPRDWSSDVCSSDLAVPLAVSHPRAELDDAVGHCAAGTVVAGKAMLERVEPIARSRGLPLLEAEAVAAAPAGGGELPAVGADC